MGRALWTSIAVSLLATAASAQEVHVQVDREPYYLGDSIAVQIVASQFENDPTPEIRVGEVDGGRLRFAGVSDSSSTSISIVNGQISRTKEVRFVYRYELLADREGQLRLPEFVVTQGANTRSTQAFELTVRGVAKTGLVGLEVQLTAGPIFVGQKVPVDVVLRIDRQAQRDLLSIDASVPLFDLPNLRFLDDPVIDADAQLEIRTAAGVLSLPARTSEENVGGRVLLTLRARRTMIALSPEAILAPPARVVINRGTGFRRDLFNQRQATATERLMAEDDPVSIEVVEVPREGRPPSFAGAVGEGFSLEVGADRSVVRLGEPILLTFILRGNGDLSSAGLARFDVEGLFDPEQFRLPAEPPAGLVGEDGKRFEASVRVLDADVREIPAIAYSWFDAKTRRFETTHSRPIALSVGAAEIIGADAVARRPGVEPAAGVGTTGPDPTPAEAPVRSTSVAISGANLAVVNDATQVLGGAAKATASPLLVPGLYALGLAFLGFATFDHRRRQRDPRETARAAAYGQALRGIDAARGTTGGEVAAGLGRVLRELVAADPAAADAAFDALIAECDALRFDPGRSPSGLSEDLAARARAFVAERRASGDRGGDRR